MLTTLRSRRGTCHGPRMVLLLVLCVMLALMYSQWPEEGPSMGGTSEASTPPRHPTVTSEGDDENSPAPASVRPMKVKEGINPSPHDGGKKPERYPKPSDEEAKLHLALVDRIRSIRQCSPLGHKFAVEVAKWLMMPTTVSAAASSPSTRWAASASDAAKTIRTKRRLIYSCESNKAGHFCGGMGDRFRGMITTAYLAFLSERRFELYHPVPVRLEEALEPNIINWIPGDSGPGYNPSLFSAPGSSRSRSSISRMKEDDGDLPPREGETQHTKWWQARDEEVVKLVVDQSLMKIKAHGKFINRLASSSPPLIDGRHEPTDSLRTMSPIRVQSNSYAVEPFTLRVPAWKRRIEEEIGMSIYCNITCYFGCFFEMLFKPSSELTGYLDGTLRSLDPSLRSRLVGDMEAAKDHKAAAGGDESTTVATQKKTTKFLRRSTASSASPLWTRLRPYIAVQVRMGGSWAAEFLAKEPFRTTPNAVPHFFKYIERARRQANDATDDTTRSNNKQLMPSDVGQNGGDCPGCPIFVTSDSAKFINLTVDTFGKENVFFVSGGGFQHIDTMNAGEALGTRKFKLIDDVIKRREYFSTLTNHYLIGLSHFVVMAQSGFGDTAFWRTRRRRRQRHGTESAGAGGGAMTLFLDMQNNRWGWEHRLDWGVEGAAPTSHDAVKSPPSRQKATEEDLECVPPAHPWSPRETPGHDDTTIDPTCERLRWRGGVVPSSPALKGCGCFAASSENRNVNVDAKIE